MANFTQAKVDFPKGRRVKSVTVDSSSEIRAIFFNGSEKEFVKDSNVKRTNVVPKKGVKVEAQVPTANLEGDETVCYLFNNELVCW